MLLVVSLHYSADEFFKSDMAVNHEKETQETEKKIANDGLFASLLQLRKILGTRLAPLPSEYGVYPSAVYHTQGYLLSLCHQNTSLQCHTQHLVLSEDL